MGHTFAITLAIPSPKEAVLDQAESMTAVEIAKNFLESQGHEVVIDLEKEGEHQYILWIGVEKNSCNWPEFNRKLYISKSGVPGVWQCYHHQFYKTSQLQRVIEEILTRDLHFMEHELAIRI